MWRLQTVLHLGRSRRVEAAIILGFVLLTCLIGFSGWRSAQSLTQFIDASNRNRYYAEVVEGLQSVIGEITEAENQSAIS